MRFLTAIRFWSGMPIARIPHDWYATVSRRLDNIRIMNGDVVTDSNSILIIPETTGSSGMGGGTDFAWNVTGKGLTMAVTPGDVELGPDTVIAWGSITGHSTTVSATTGDSYLWIWVNVTVTGGAEAATMLSGTTITALNSIEKETILQKRIAKVTFVDDVVTKIERYQCGNIAISRAA